jgi:hypothetical protein
MTDNLEKICQKCGTKNYGVIYYCLKCGAQLSDSAEDAATMLDSPGSRFEAPTVLDYHAEPPAFIEVSAGPDAGHRYELVDGLTFGRSSGCDIVIDSPKASRSHARIEQNEYQQWILVDLGSTNGTIHNQARITGPSVLYNGDEFKIGDFHFQVTIKKPYHTPSPPNQAAPQSDEQRGQPLQPLPPRKGCQSTTALIVGGILVIACLCVGIYYGVIYLSELGYF